MTTRSNNYVELLDENQIKLCEHFEDNPLLDTPEHVARTLAWITFYRRNIDLFVKHYFGLHPFPYQEMLLHELGRTAGGTVVAGRATAKTYTVGMFACAYAVLYPGSFIVCASATKEQSRILVYEKIRGELMRDSATLNAEIETISTSKNDTNVKFWNGSTITVVVGNENARGHRAHLLILDEFRMFKKAIVDTALIPFLINHVYPYHSIGMYRNCTVPTGTVQISSSWYTSHWMWQSMNDALQAYMKHDNQILMGFDYALCLRHNIKSWEAVRMAYRSADPVSWKIEYQNYMIAQGADAFFTFDMLNNCRVLKHVFYPRKNSDVAAGKRREKYVKQDGEIRLLCCDISFVTRKDNDNSAFLCLRLLPEASERIDGYQVQQGYKRQLAYLEVMQGGETTMQAIRIKQLFYDFDCDICVLDIRNAGRLCPTAGKLAA